MSMTPERMPGPDPDGFPVGAGPQVQDPAPRVRVAFWHRRVWGVFFVIFSLEIGLFLLIFPWMDSWDVNHLQGWFPRLQNSWEDPYLRGAVSGLGLANIYIACWEVVRLIRRGHQ
jgi:hypothetical protein